MLKAASGFDFAWRPEARARTLGELVTHFADLSAWTSIVMTNGYYDLAERPTANQTPQPQTALNRFDTSAPEDVRRLLDASSVNRPQPGTRN